jgi:hypothetical protein
LDNVLADRPSVRYSSDSILNLAKDFAGDFALARIQLPPRHGFRQPPQRRAADLIDRQLMKSKGARVDPQPAPHASAAFDFVHIRHHPLPHRRRKSRGLLQGGKHPFVTKRERSSERFEIDRKPTLPRAVQQDSAMPSVQLREGNV